MGDLSVNLELFPPPITRTVFDSTKLQVMITTIMIINKLNK